MSEIKVSLSVVLPGGTMFSKEECLKTTQKVIEKKSKSGKVYKKVIESQVEDWDKMQKHSMKVTEADGSNPEVITFRTRGCKPAAQSLNISEEAYYHMIGRTCPAWLNPSKWLRMSREQRLEAHLQRIAEGLGGMSFTYQVFED